MFIQSMFIQPAFGSIGRKEQSAMGNGERGEYHEPIQWGWTLVAESSEIGRWKRCEIEYPSQIREERVSLLFTSELGCGDGMPMG